MLVVLEIHLIFFIVAFPPSLYRNTKNMRPSGDLEDMLYAEQEYGTLVLGPICPKITRDIFQNIKCRLKPAFDIGIKALLSREAVRTESSPVLLRSSNLEGT